MTSFVSQLSGFLSSIGDILVHVFEPFINAFSILETAIALPLEIYPIMPLVLGSSICIVVAVMIIKFILGR